MRGGEEAAFRWGASLVCSQSADVIPGGQRPQVLLLPPASEAEVVGATLLVRKSSLFLLYVQELSTGSHHDHLGHKPGSSASSEGYSPAILEEEIKIVSNNNNKKRESTMFIRVKDAQLFKNNPPCTLTFWYG